MAFLDNSGDIILDAVLTEEGRRKLARGAPLNIRSFALADDEINYGTYELDHPDGSAYEDLEVLQTPVFEAMTGRNSRLNHPLLKLHGTFDLLYMPVAKVNEKITISSTTMAGFPGDRIFESLGSVAGVFYIACTADTFTAFDTALAAGASPEQAMAEAAAAGGFGESGPEGPALKPEPPNSPLFIQQENVHFF